MMVQFGKQFWCEDVGGGHLICRIPVLVAALCLGAASYAATFGTVVIVRPAGDDAGVSRIDFAHRVANTIPNRSGSDLEVQVVNP